ncbi:MAG: hypothetical protein JRI34_11695 [Deltaproteobacteria bacterium]|nr:hypothetical protein [Deltaproteobacteria bacterium]
MERDAKVRKRLIRFRRGLDINLKRYVSSWLSLADKKTSASVGSSIEPDSLPFFCQII